MRESCMPQPSTVPLLVLILCWLCPLPAQEPLSVGMNTAQQQYNQMLQALQQGRIEALNKIAMEHLLGSIGRIDARDPRIIRQRQQDLIQLLSGLPEEQRDQAIDLLDRRCRDWLRHQTSPRRSSLLLPAPAAVQAIDGAADYFFDHGDMHAFLQCMHLLDRDDGDRRIAIARKLSGAEFSVYKPGLLTPEQAPLILLEKGRRVHWVIHNNYLHACDPWHVVQWQRALGKYSEIQTGPGHVLIKDQAGFHIIDHNGYSEALPHIPQARSIAINSHRAWFAIGKRVYAWDLKNKNIQSYTLPGEALCAPIDDGARSLWLCEHDLVYCADGDVHSVRHQQTVDSDWALSHNGRHCYLYHPDGRSLRIDQLSDSLAANPLRTHCVQGQHALAWHTADKAEKEDLKQQWLLAGAAFLQQHLTALLQLDYSDSDRMLLYHRASRPHYPQVPAGMQALLHKLLATDAADHLLPMAADDYLRQDYRHALSLRGLHRLLQNMQDSSVPTSAARQLALGQSPVDSAGADWQDPHNLRYSAPLQRNGDVLVSCRNQEQQILWRHRLPRSGYQPSLAMGVSGNAVVLSIGMNTCTLLDAQNGTLLVDGNLPGTFNDPKRIQWNGSHQISSIGPAGIYNTILLHQQIGEHPHNEFITLRQQLRWHLALGDVLIYSDGETAWRHPGHLPLALPRKLIAADNVELNGDGIVADGRLYRWRSD